MMINSCRLAAIMLVFLAGVPYLVMAAGPFTQSSGPNGLVEIEAEDYDANVSQGGHSWTPVYPLGFSGTAALEATPNNGATNSTGFVSTSPRLDYNVNFVRTGVHYVWIRGMGSTSSDDSLHVGLDGAAVASATHITNFDTGLSWSNALSGGAVATINVPSTGAHTLNLWMREDGMVVDKIVLTSNGAYTPLGAGTTLFSDDFNDGDAAGWTVVDNCIHATSAWAVVGNEYTQTGKCNGVTPEGAVVGSYARSNVPLPGNVDIQLRLRGQDPALDGVAGNDSSNWKYGAIGVLFGYQGDNNYYRFEMNALKGYRKLWRRQGGAFTELNTSPQSYTGGQWVTLRIVHQNGVLLVYMDGQQVLATQDGTYTNTRLALFCSGNSSCSFDDVVVKAAPATPLAGLNLPDGGVPTHASSEYFVDGDGTLDVAGFATQATGVGGIRFVVDEGSGGAQTQTDTTPPYTAQFSGLATGDHTVSAHLLDGSLAPLPAAEASVTLPQVGSQGVHLYGSGDSITLGWTDNLSSDDVSLDGRNTGGGYPPVLNNYLSSYNSGKPVTVWNDGNSGETTVEGAAHIAAVLARTPAVQAYLFGYGTNDSGGSMLLDSGLGLGPGDAGYPGSYKYYVQQYINAVTGAGKRVYLAKIPPYLSDAGRDATIQTYNQVIDELVTKLQTDHPTDYVNYVPPDFHTYFTAHPGELGSDGIHPTGTGYASMGRLWCEALNAQHGWFCLDDDADGLLNSVEATLGTNPLLADSDGDGLVDGYGGIVAVSVYPDGVDSDGDGFVDGEQSFGTNPLLADSDGDRLGDGLEVANNADPLDPASWPNLADGDIAPLGAPDGQVNGGDFLVATRLVLGLETATPLELAHGDLYPPGSPDGVINLQDLILLRQLQ